MKREIKFRAWQNNKMIYSPLNSNYGLQRFFGLLYEDAHIMQFTGLHDKNGKEIYEGDIYIINDGSPYKIMFVNGAFVGEKHEGYCSPIGWEIQECNDELNPSNFNTKIVIIGNIYETPQPMQHLKYIDLYEDGVIQRRVRCDKIPRTEQTKLRQQLYKELETAAQRNPEKTFWIELKNE